MKALEALGSWLGRPDWRPEADIAAEIRAELEHHLACAAQDLVREGMGDEEARAEARRRFGDLDTIQRACLKIQTGGRTMLQRIHLAVTGLLLLTVAAMAVTIFQSRRNAAIAREMAMAARMEAEDRLQRVLEAEQLARAQADPAVIGAGDVLEIFDAVGLGRSFEVAVPENGLVEIHAGMRPVKVAGLTCDEAGQALSEVVSGVRMQSFVKVKIKVARQSGKSPEAGGPR